MRRSWLLAPALLVAWIFRGLLLGELPYHRDISVIFWPFKRFLAEGLRGGGVPEWSPWDGLGTPLLPVPVLSTFHPTTLLYYLLPFPAAFVAQLLVALPLGLVGAWLLARRLGARPAYAALSATAWTASAYFVGLTEFTSMSLATAALPWLWWALLRPRRGALVIAVCVAWMLLAGDPHTLIMGLMGGALLLPRRARALPPLALAAALGGLLAAVQVLPTLSFYPESPRSLGLALASPDYWRLTAAQLVGFVWQGAYPPLSSLFESTYVGVSVAALALLGAIERRPRRGPLLVVVALFVTLAAGSGTPLWGLFSAVVPFWKSFQFPVKAIGPAVLAIALLSGRGAALVARHLPAERRRLAGAALVALVAIDLGLSNGELVRSSSADFYAEPPLARSMREAGVSSEGQAYISLWLPSAELGGADQIDAAQLRALAPTAGASYGLPAANAYFQAFSGRFAELVFSHKKEWRTRVVRYYGTGFVVGSSDLVAPESRARALAYDAEVDAWLVPLEGALPRAYLTRGVRPLPRAEVVAAIYDPSFRPGEEVIIEAEAAPELGPRAPSGPATPVPVKREGDRLTLEVETSSSAMLVVNESYFSGVRATIDGEPARVLPANHVVRAVEVPAGRHLVRFEYDTPGLKLGAALSLLGLLALSGLWITERRRAQPRSNAASSSSAT